MNRYWLKKLVGDINQQKLLFLALFFLCTFGVTSYIALTMGYTNLYASLDAIYDETNFADAEISTKPDIWFNESTMESFINSYIQQHPELGSANIRLITSTGYNVSLEEDDLTRYYFTEGRAIGVNFNNPSEEIINGFIFIDGQYQPNEQDNSVILLEAHFADYFQLRSEDFLITRIAGFQYNFSIQSIVHNPESLVLIPSRYDFLPNNRFGVIYLPISHLQDYANLTGLANNILLKLPSETDLNTRNQIIYDFFGELNQFSNYSFTSPILQEHQVSNWAIHMDLEEIQKIAFVLPILILGVASIAVFITLNRLVQSQRRIIGIASSLGYTPTEILLHYATFSFLIGFIGSFIGLFIGILLSGLITWVYAYFMGFPAVIVIETQISILVIGLFVGLAVSCLSGILPAWKANRLSPREALQGRITVGGGDLSLIEKIVHYRGFNLKITIPLRNLFRQRSRTIATIIALSASVMILVVAGSFNDSINKGITQQFIHTSQYDVTINFEGYKFTDLGLMEDITYIEEIPGVIAVEPVLELPSVVEVNGKSQSVLILAWNTSTPNVHSFQWTSKNDYLLSNGSLVLTTGLAQNIGFTTGKSLNFGYPNVPEVNYAYQGAWLRWWLAYQGEPGRNAALNYLSELISQNKESFSFSNVSQEVRFKTTNATVTGISEEIWGSVVYTTAQTISHAMGIDIFKNSVLDIDLTPFSKLILKVKDPRNLTLLEDIKAQVSTLDEIRSINFGYDMQQSVRLTLNTFNIVIGVFIIFACLLASAAIFTTIYVNFQERSREIATMLTLGLSDQEYLYIISLENILQSIVGIIGGIPPGLLLAEWILDNILRLFYFKISVNSFTWIILWGGVLIVVLLSQVPAVLQVVRLNLAEVTKEISE
jgi:ABC-type lipoprotein release transport system permease subunit